jgi:hypothetical protein
VIALGHAFNIDKHSIEVFSESFIRSHIIFQLSKLAEGVLGYCRTELKLPPFIVISPGRVSQAEGLVKYVYHLSDLI